jgi:hypothetical protein
VAINPYAEESDELARARPDYVLAKSLRVPVGPCAAADCCAGVNVDSIGDAAEINLERHRSRDRMKYPLMARLSRDLMGLAPMRPMLLPLPTTTTDPMALRCRCRSDEP